MVDSEGKFSFIQKELYIQELNTNKRRKKLSRRVIQIFFQINANLYHTNDATPLYNKEKRYFTVF